jgi:O-antigen/teichoic acid export membrane protein
VYLCVNLLSGVIGAWFRAADKTAVGAFLLSNRRLLEVVVSIVTLILGGDAIQLAVSLVVWQLVAVAAIAITASSLSSWEVLRIGGATWAEFRTVLKPSAASAAIPIAQVITLQGGLQILNQFGMPHAIVAYSMGRTLMRLIIQAGITTNNALSPEIARLYGAGDAERARRFTLKASGVVVGICVVGYVMLAATGPTLVRVWSHGQIDVSAATLLLIGAHALLNVIWYVPASMLTATNRHVSIGMVYAASSVICAIGWLCMGTRVSPVIGAAMLLAIPEACVLLLVAYRLAFADRRSNP